MIFNLETWNKITTLAAPDESQVIGPEIVARIAKHIEAETPIARIEIDGGADLSTWDATLFVFKALSAIAALIRIKKYLSSDLTPMQLASALATELRQRPELSHLSEEQALAIAHVVVERGAC